MKRGRGTRWLAIGIAALATSGCAAADKPQAGSAKSAPERVEVVLSAAASLSDSLQQIQLSYEAKHPNIKLRLNIGSSGALQQQIEQGAPADVFVSAAVKNMDALVDKGLIAAESRTVLLRNELVLIAPNNGGQEAAQGISDLGKTAIKHIAIGEPESVPAGGYAKEALAKAKLWSALAPKLVFAKDVRQVLTYVETGNAEAGFVYKTDALTSKQVRIVEIVDAKLLSKPIEYPAGIVKASRHQAEAGDLYAYLQSKLAAGVFIRYGFTPAKP